MLKSLGLWKNTATSSVNSESESPKNNKSESFKSNDELITNSTEEEESAKEINCVQLTWEQWGIIKHGQDIQILQFMQLWLASITINVICLLNYNNYILMLLF